jgi:hypothetical protein
MFFDTFLKKINKKGFSKVLWYYCCPNRVVRRQWCDISCFAIKNSKHFSKNIIN